VPRKVLEVELTGGEKVRVWRADDGQDYFCHCLTFGGKGAPGGAASPLAEHVPTILAAHYEAIPESQARAGDILVWQGAGPNEVVHSAILAEPVVTPGKGYLDYASTLRTKNGIMPETDMTLGRLVERYYGESYRAYRRRQG
jgi:hypothetical protein